MTSEEFSDLTKYSNPELEKALSLIDQLGRLVPFSRADIEAEILRRKTPATATTGTDADD